MEKPIPAEFYHDMGRDGPEGQKIIYIEQQGTSVYEEPNDYNNLDGQNNQQSDNSSIFVMGFLIVIILLIIIIAMLLVKKR